MPYKNKDKQAEYSRKWYSANKELQKKRVTEQKKKKREWIQSLKSAGCGRCGETHPNCLDWHHLVPSEKEFKLANAINMSKANVLKEIKKCELLCANCHRKEHSQVMKW